jgi:hypothetical protein
MRIVDAETPQDFVEFTSPMADATLKGCHAVQNLGAAETYLRRYLYQNAFEIVESDVLNGTHNPDEKPPKQQPAQTPKPPRPALAKTTTREDDENDLVRLMKAAYPNGDAVFTEEDRKETRVQYKKWDDKTFGEYIAKAKTIVSSRLAGDD